MELFQYKKCLKCGYRPKVVKFKFCPKCGHSYKEVYMKGEKEMII